MSSTESPSGESPATRVAVLVREDVLHVADTMNPDRQEWPYDEDTLGAFTRHLEAIEPALVRVGTSSAPAHAMLLLRRLLETAVPILVLEGATDEAQVSEPRDLLGEEPGSSIEREDDRLAELRALSRRVDQLRSMRETEAERVAGTEAGEIAESIEEHRRWLAERERDLVDRLAERLRASSWWRLVSSDGAST